MSARTAFPATGLWILAGLLLCAATAIPAEHRYRVSVSLALDRMDVEARFGDDVTQLSARDRGAGSFLLEARDCTTGAALERRGRRLAIGDGVDCVAYRIDLAQASAGDRRNRVLDDESLVVSPAHWLWRPPLTPGVTLRVDFELADGMRVALPWEPLDASGNRYRLRRSPESAYAPAVFGRFDYAVLSVPGARLRVALPSSRSAIDRSVVLAWLEAAATDVSLAYGRFPNPSPLVVVIPASTEGRWRSTSAVPFGRVIRDGGEAIELFVDPGRPLPDYLGDWTATHEFSHLMLPYLERDARWVSEGFAQYYQNVLMARSGSYTPTEAWQKILAGLARGEASGPELSPNEAAAMRRGARMKVYWSGAALALIADVELRRRSGGTETLDDVLDRLQRCCLPSSRSWTGEEFFARLDALLDEPLFLPLYRNYADRPGFPDTGRIVDDLGIVAAGDGLHFDQSAELARVRDDITRPDPGVSAWRERLSAD